MVSHRSVFHGRLNSTASCLCRLRDVARKLLTLCVTLSDEAWQWGSWLELGHSSQTLNAAAKSVCPQAVHPSTPGLNACKLLLSQGCQRTALHTMRFEGNAKVLAGCKLRYWYCSECSGQLGHSLPLSLPLPSALKGVERSYRGAACRSAPSP